MRTAILILAVAAFFLSYASAAEMSRKIDFTTILMDQDDRPLEECADQSDKDCKIKRPLSLGSASMRALSVPEAGMDPVKSFKRGQLALSVYRSAGAELTAEEITTIKEQLAKHYGPIVVVRAFAILDPATAK